VQALGAAIHSVSLVPAIPRTAIDANHLLEELWRGAENARSDEKPSVPYYCDDSYGYYVPDCEVQNERCFASGVTCEGTGFYCFGAASHPCDWYWYSWDNTGYSVCERSHCIRHPYGG